MRSNRTLFLPLYCVLVVLAVQTASAQALPMKITSYLNNHYSGWKFDWDKPGRTSVCGEEVKTSVVSGYFNDDRKLDYAVRIVKGRSGYIIGFIAQGVNYTSHIIESSSATDIKTTELKVARKGEDTSFGRLKNDAVVTVPCASDAVAYYRFQNGSFK